MKKKLTAVLLAAVLCMTVFAGCSTEPATAEEPVQLREFTDSLGRTVMLPETISRVAISGPLTQIYVFPLCPELLVGFSTAFSEDAQKYIPEEYLALPELGQLYGGKGTMNEEALLAAAPDVVIDVGEAKDGMAEDLDDLQEKTGIPFVHIDATVMTAPDAYRKMGDLLGESSRAEELAAWCEKTQEAVLSVMEQVDAADARKSVVYCLGPKGLNVLANGSFHAEIIGLCAENAAMLDNPVPHGDGNETDMEQLILWNPDVLLFRHDSIGGEIDESGVWGQLRAVQTGEHYQIPCGPYGWISSPPAVQCYLGMLWLTDLLYPEYTEYDLQSEVSDYYRLFYGYELSNADFAELTAG